MKKMLTILLMLFYIIPAIGVNVSIAFCEGEQVKTSCPEKEKGCFCGPKAMKKGCCENKSQIFKLDDRQQKAEMPSQKFSNPFHAVVAIPPSFNPLIFVRNINSEVYRPAFWLNIFRQPIYLLNRVFRI